MSNLPNLLDIYATDAEWRQHEAYVNEHIARLEQIEQEKARCHALGAQYAQQTFQTFDPHGQPKLRDALRIVKQFTANVLHGQFAILILLGGNGSGKSHLLHSLTNVLGGVCIDEFKLVDDYQRTRSFDSQETEEGFINRICSYRMRCIDEVGRSDRVSLSQEVLFRIIDRCVIFQKPVALASNMSKEQFVEHVGSAVRSRLNSCALSVDLFGIEDYRVFSRSQ